MYRENSTGARDPDTTRHFEHISRKARRQQQNWYSLWILHYCDCNQLTSHLDQCLKPPEKPFSLDVQMDYIEAWKSIDPVVDMTVETTIEGALKLALEIGNRDGGMQTLVTGSLYLVGGALSFLEPTTPDIPHRTS